MKLAIIFTCAIGAFAFGCSSSSSGSAPSGPVAAQPLAGNVDGQAFNAKVGLAHKGFSDGKKSIDIYDADATCDTPMSNVKREIFIDVPWTAGTAKDFNLNLSGGDSQTATFVINDNGTPDNIISTTGRVEVVDAPTDVGSSGKIRLRAIADANNVEGEVTILVCE